MPEKFWGWGRKPLAVVLPRLCSLSAKNYTFLTKKIFFTCYFSVSDVDYEKVLFKTEKERCKNGGANHKRRHAVRPAACGGTADHLSGL